MTRVYQQGDINGLCGVYAVVNAVARLFPSLTYRHHRAIYLRLIQLLADKELLAPTMAHGMELDVLVSLLASVSAYLEMELGAALMWNICSRRAMSLERFWERLQAHQQGGGAVILRLSGRREHWTCVSHVSANRLVLADSTALRYLNRSHCTVIPSKTHGPHGLWPAQTLLLRPVPMATVRGPRGVSQSVSASKEEPMSRSAPRSPSSLITLGSMVKKVSRMSRHHQDMMVAAGAIQFQDLSTVVIEGEAHRLLPWAQRGMAAQLGVPVPYLNRCAPEIQGLNLNYWLGRQRESREYFLRFDGQSIRAVFTTRYRPVDNLAILERLLEMGYPEDSEVQGYCDPGFMSLSIPNWRQKITVKGDRQVPGVSIANSEVGIMALRVSGFYLRLVCTNGMIVPVQGEQRGYRHISSTLLQEFPAIIQRSLGQAEDHKRSLALSMASPVANSEETFQSLQHRFQLTAPEQEAVAWGFSHEPGETMFYIVNAYTKGAQHPSLPVESRYRLQRVGGQILEMMR